jgi:hypothetical protein
MFIWQSYKCYMCEPFVTRQLSVWYSNSVQTDLSISLSTLAIAVLMLQWCQGRWRGADVTKECLEKSFFIFPLCYYANCVSTTLTVLIRHNVESWKYSNPVYTGGPRLSDVGLLIQPVLFYFIHCHLLIHFCMPNLDFFFNTPDNSLSYCTLALSASHWLLRTILKVWWKNVIWMWKEVHKYVVPLIGMQMGTDCCVKRRRLVFNFHFTSSSRKLMGCCQQVLFCSINISCCSGLNSPSQEGVSDTSSSVGCNSHS